MLPREVGAYSAFLQNGSWGCLASLWWVSMPPLDRHIFNQLSIGGFLTCLKSAVNLALSAWGTILCLAPETVDSGQCRHFLAESAHAPVLPLLICGGSLEPWNPALCGAAWALLCDPKDCWMPLFCWLGRVRSPGSILAHLEFEHDSAANRSVPISTQVPIRLRQKRNIRVSWTIFTMFRCLKSAFPPWGVLLLERNHHEADHA